MKVEHYRKAPIFEFDDYTISFELSKEARMLLRHLQNIRGDKKYDYIMDGFIPLDYKYLNTELDYPIDIIKQAFFELERLGFVSRCVARFVQIKTTQEV